MAGEVGPGDDPAVSYADQGPQLEVGPLGVEAVEALELELRAKGREIKQLVSRAGVLEGERDSYEAREHRGWPTVIPGGTAL